ncbi:signal transduction histidine kinase [Sphingomonas vulcanisoli]|uniref:histidine kinase n=1 Tax=Sphingomonas vulcanisoli TaxID=1658060 RepID=A0ABX0TSH8_9SPHN|nr:ATP-binding protein [Sphingomonas vulcanisoli]NIJ08473.1 signal transduction histidine kinase [Sphingomonas vulcanisoli]
MRDWHQRPLGLLGRLLAILLLTLVIEFAASTVLYERSSRALIHDDEAHRLAEHLVIARRLIAAQPLAERPAMAERLTTNRYDVHWAGTTRMPPPLGRDRGLAYSRVLDWEPSLADSDLRVALVAAGRQAQLFGALRLGDGSWLRFRAAEPVESSQPSWHRILIALLPATVVLIVAALLFRQALRPMGMLARAADRIGRSGGITLPEAGPGEVRRVIRAFNAMQARIDELINSRTQALAAVGHDLRTPLARLQLRSEAIGDPALRTSVGGDVEEMKAMVQSLLSFLGGDDDPERPVRTDLAVMAATITDDAADRGADALYVGDDHLEISVRPIAMKRAIANLVENALHYGGCARVAVLTEAGAAIVRIDDDGPGVLPEQIPAITEPFARLDPARSRNTSGLGLGLAIVDRVAKMEGGSLMLANRPEGGFRAEIRLPLP